MADDLHQEPGSLTKVSLIYYFFLYEKDLSFTISTFSKHSPLYLNVGTLNKVV